MKPKPFSELNHFTIPVAMSHAFQSMNAAHTVWEAEVIALVPAAQHSKKAHAGGMGKGRIRTTTANGDGTRQYAL
ncbi:hypothetical protein GCM10010272_70040 [Streptomyces lateritius]|nr:hypothetical protein GCM10010272_70040 [Streptomyces lateritius]